MMKNTIYIMLKALFVRKIFTFCPELLVIKEHGLIRKLRLISKIMTSETGQQIIARGKGNQAIN